MGRPWSAAEEDVLRGAWGVRDLREVSAELGRTPHALMERAYKIGLPPRRPQRPWTMRELDALWETSGLSAKEAAAALGRTACSVRRARDRLGIRRGLGRWEPWELELVRDTSLSSAQVAAQTGRTQEAVLSKRGQMGVRVGRPRPRQDTE